MKKTILILLIGITSFAQTKNEKIKIILMGTFHYGATGDRNSTNFKDLFSERRQKELDFMTSKLNAFGVKKIFVETDFREQKNQIVCTTPIKTEC